MCLGAPLLSCMCPGTPPLRRACAQVLPPSLMHVHTMPRYLRDGLCPHPRSISNDTHAEPEAHACQFPCDVWCGLWIVRPILPRAHGPEGKATSGLGEVVISLRFSISETPSSSISPMVCHARALEGVAKSLFPREAVVFKSGDRL